MVPGMTDLERHAAELQRLARLADSALGPTRAPNMTQGTRRKERDFARRVTFRCRRFTLTPWIGQRVGLNRQHAI
jgi:hypothetical protein